MIDIDHFKRINDTFGHLTGDAVLREFVGLVSDNIRKNDVFARWGGEEFMILAPNSELESAGLLAEKLRLIISSARFESDAAVTASFGVAQLKPGDTFDTFTMRADAALYRAKDKGRNRVEVEQ
jgi:diguanylate cyclase (GGDEF)-like protein